MHKMCVFHHRNNPQFKTFAFMRGCNCRKTLQKKKKGPQWKEGISSIFGKWSSKDRSPKDEGRASSIQHQNTFSVLHLPH